jgi:Dna[CI] antecedent, DciA
MFEGSSMARSNRRGKSDGPVPIAETLAKVASQLPKKSLQGLALVQSAWDAKVEPGLRDLGVPIKFEEGTLVLEVVQPAAATQLRLAAGGLLRALNGADGVAVERLEIIVRRG